MSQIQEDENTGLIRLNKYLAHCGVCTRKEAVDIIKKGMVKVNDTIVTEPFYVMQPEDVVYYHGVKVSPKKSFTYLLFNKSSKSAVHIAKDSKRPSVIELALKTSGRTLMEATSLDDDNCGLMLLSDDQDFINRIKERFSHLHCRYEVVCEKELPANLTDAFKKRGATDSISNIEIIEEDAFVRMIMDTRGIDDKTLKEILSESGCMVTKLDLLKIGALTKKDLKRGWSRPLTDKEMIFISHFG